MDVQDPNRSARPTGRRFGWPSLVAVALASAVLALGAMAALTRAPHDPLAAARSATRFLCPMHPSVVQDHAGNCPICGMKLVPSETAPTPAAPPHGTTYMCPMHPEVTHDEPGSCPKCGMPLEPTSPEASREGAGESTSTFYTCPMHPEVVQDHPGDCPLCAMALVPRDAPAEAGSSAAGLADVHIDPARQQLIGLRTAEVKTGSVGGTWRTVGRVAMDETRVRTLTLKVSGYIERVFANFVGKVVAEGEPLFSVYSPELLAAQEELLLALRTQRDLETAEALAVDGRTLLAAARRKLELWDVSPRDLRRLEQTRAPTKSLTFRAPIAGVVTKKNALEGARVEPGAQLYELVDLSEVWVLADVYESELRHVHLGMPADLTLNAYPGRAFTGKVSYVDPLLDPKTRTVRVRLAVPNPTGVLRPEMFGDVVLHGSERDGLLVPADAVIESGTRSVVFVSLGEGKFRPREVTIGQRLGDGVEVLSGLSAGEHVVVGANFLLDSESRLRSTLHREGD